MNPKSSQAKGKRFEKFIANEIELSGLGSARREIGSGSGKKKGDIYCNLPFLIEAKNQKKIQLWQAIDQAKSQAEKGNENKDKWCLIIRDPRTSEESPSCYAIIDMWQFFQLLKKDSEPLIKEPDRQLKWKIQRFIEYGKSIIKELQ